MIVEPVPTAPRDPVRRTGRLLGFVAPPALLVAVVALALAGGPGEDQPAAEASLAPEPSPPAVVVADPTAPPDARGEVVDFPDRILGLEVLTPSRAEALRVTGAPGEPLLVAGYLSIPGVRAECIDRFLGPQGSLCHRVGVLAEAPLSPYVGEDRWRGIGRHLHPEFPPAVRWPTAVGLTTPQETGIPLPVVVLGRFGDPRAQACAIDAFECTEGFVVERILWAAGETYARTTTIDAAIDIDLSEDPWRQRRNDARANLTDITIVSISALLTPPALAKVDAAAAEAVGELPPDAAPVWYVRGMDLRDGADGVPLGTVRWVVVSDGDGTVLARGADDQAR